MITLRRIRFGWVCDAHAGEEINAYRIMWGSLEEGTTGRK